MTLGPPPGGRVATRASSLLEQLRALGVRVWSEDGRVRVSAPKGVLTDALRNELALHRDEILAALEEDGASAPLDRIKRREGDGTAPLSFAQQRLWFLHQLEPDSPAYTIAAWSRLEGPVDVTVLERALTEVMRRHEILRTTFSSVDGEPVQMIAPAAPMMLPVHDLTELPEADRRHAADRLAQEEARRPFDLAKGPLFRVRLLRLGAHEHRVVFAVHHSIFDGWSLGVVTKEIGHLYDAYARGEVPSLAELPFQYSDFAAWQRRSLKGGVLERQREYWLSRLRGAPGSLALPMDRRRSNQSGSAGASYVFELSSTLSAAVRALARRQGVTPFMTLLAAFVAVLHRYTNESDIVVGSPVANRTRVELEGLIGLFANTLVLRIDLSGNPTFSDVLVRVRDVTLGAFEHQNMPFEKLVEDLQPERALGQNPLFQVIFVLQQALPGPATPTFVTVGSPFDLSMFFTDGLDGVFRGAVEYKTDLFDEATIAALTSHLETLLAAAVADPLRPIAALPLLADDERRRLLADWNATDTDVPAVDGAHELVARQAHRTPDAVAVVCEDRQLTYAELASAAERLAGRLRACGVRPGIVVGLCVERSLEMIVGLLGILEAGGAYLPLDPAYPAERLAFMLQDAGCPVLVTQARLRDVVPNPPARVVLLDDPSDEPPADHVDAAPSPAPDDLAYVIYTSGSTGRPKGVQIPHRALVNLLSAMSRDPGLTEGDVLLAVTTLSFDIAGLELFLPLIVGARLVLARREATMDGARLRELLAIHRVTVMQATPTTWRLLLDAGWRAPETFKILCGGEALSPELAERLVDSGAAVWNVYGPTETTIWSTLHRLSTTHGPVPIGRPIANTQLYVLDVHGEPVPIGVPGELYIGGRGVAHGYLNRAELTAERFVPDRFRPAAGGLLYRTGDLVRCRRDGTVEFLGRLDDQVKLRGFRIELGEIESVLLQHPDVQEATVVVREGPGSDKQLVGYVVAQRPLTALELRDLLRQTLPDYMIPTAFVLLDRLPLTNNGKIDRRALPDPGRAMGTRATGRVEPTDELERLLVGIWEETLERSPIGIRDDFFDLGGHSLLAVRVFARLHKRLGHNLPLATLFQAPTIEALATLIRTQGWKTPWKSLIAIQPHGSRPPLFAVPGVGGNVLGFSDLARLLGLDQPLYGLQSVGLTGESEPLTRIEEIAEHFLTEMRAIQPQGPYYLFGACIGGVVAYEMAQQLVAAGQQVSLLALVETWRPTAGQGAPRQTSQLAAVLSFAADRMRLYMRTLWQLEPDERREYIRARLTMLKEAFASRDVFRGDRSEFYQSRVTRANLDAFRHYTARQYPGSLVVFTAQDRQTLTPQDGRLAWGELAAEGMEVYSVPGHDSGSALFGSHVRLLVGHLQRYLATEPFRQGTRS